MVELEEDGRGAVVFVLVLELAEGAWKDDGGPDEGLCLGVCRLELGEGVCE